MSSNTISTPYQPGLRWPAVDRELPIESDALSEFLVELVSYLQPSLQSDCKWLGEGEVEVVGRGPVDAGEFADIFVGMRGTRKVAIKHYRFNSSSNYLLTYMRFYEEALARSKLRNHSLVPFFGIYSTLEHPMCLVFEYMDNLNLKQYLRENKCARRCELLLEAARAIERLHHMGVLHKNLKLTNILVDIDGHAHLGGLGTAFLPPARDGADIDRFFCGAAPELAGHRGPRSTKAGATEATDVYAFGVLAWEAFAGENFFRGKSKVAAVIAMWRGVRPPRPNHPELSDRLWKALKGCWKANPAQRTTISQAIVALEAEVAIYRPRSSPRTGS